MKQGSLEDRVANASSLLDILLILKEAIAIDTHVATVAYVDSIVQQFDSDHGYGVARCKPFPLASGQEEYLIQAYFVGVPASFTKNQKVLVVFCDRNFISSLQAPGGSPKSSADMSLHSLKYGVIVSSPDMELTDEEKEELLDF